jgi:hypothetical protein
MTKAPALAVFVNCPFENEYQNLFRAIVFTIFRCGFRARCALEVIDGGEVRIDKIIRIIRECPYGVHDISRTELNAAGLPRFNMPFELGLFLGAKRFGDRPQRAKKTLVMDTEPYRYQAYLSDIGGQDIAAHGGDVAEVIRSVRDFLNEPRIHGSPLPSANVIAESYRDFLGALEKLCEAEGQKPQTLPYSDYEWFVTSYIATPAT